MFLTKTHIYSREAGHIELNGCIRDRGEIKPLVQSRVPKGRERIKRNLYRQAIHLIPLFLIYTNSASYKRTQN